MLPAKPATLNANAARTQLRALLDRVLRGETILITRYGQPIAALVPYDQWQTQTPPPPPAVLPAPSA